MRARSSRDFPSVSTFLQRLSSDFIFYEETDDRRRWAVEWLALGYVNSLDVVIRNV